MTCRTCKFLGVEPNAFGKIIVRSANAYRCLSPVPDIPNLPTSMTKCYDFRWPPSRTYVIPSEGINCPIYVVREKAARKAQGTPEVATGLPAAEMATLAQGFKPAL